YFLPYSQIALAKSFLFNIQSATAIVKTVSSVKSHFGLNKLKSVVLMLFHSNTEPITSPITAPIIVFEFEVTGFLKQLRSKIDFMQFGVLVITAQCKRLPKS